MDSSNVRDRITEIKKVRLGSIFHNLKNWRTHSDEQRAVLDETVKSEVGWAGVPLVYHSERTGGLTYIDGHARKEQFPDLLARVAVTDLNDAEADKLLALYDTIGGMAGTDPEAWLALMSEVEVAGGATAEALAAQTLLAELETKEDAPPASETRAAFVVPVMDYIFPSDNEWGIPLLFKDKQALSVVAPFNRWGTGARSIRMEGTYHFYTDDYRFEGVWRNPEKIIESGCRAVIEPNFSTNDDMPRAVVLWHIFRKRWLARYWQSNGVYIFVDLALAPAHRDLALLGVPRGWRSYATYTYGKGYDLEWLEADYNQAAEHAETNEIVFLVYGGGEKYGETCRERGWLWFPAHQQAYFKNVTLGKVRKD